jgi:hypothetical protein
MSLLFKVSVTNLNKYARKYVSQSSQVVAKDTQFFVDVADKIADEFNVLVVESLLAEIQPCFWLIFMLFA